MKLKVQSKTRATVVDVKREITMNIDINGTHIHSVQGFTNHQESLGLKPINVACIVAHTL